MPKRMLIDASHPEETRVVVLDGNKVEEFDFEAASKRPLKGNIYLAKVTRVEPSLQAAFVEYGGNRQGFLAFSEIHPDYYQIPIADRQALLAEQEADARRRQEDEIESFEITSAPKPHTDEEDSDDITPAESAVEPLAALPAHPISEDSSGTMVVVPETDGDDHEEVFEHRGAGADHEDAEDEHLAHGHLSSEDEMTDPSEDEVIDEIAEEEQDEDVADEQTIAATSSHIAPEDNVHLDLPQPEVTEQIPDIQTASELTENSEQQSPEALHAQRPSQRFLRRRHYKIQEVVKRRQIILVQVVKEERGNKGAALTTYLSLAGRYCVLMPNTPRGGGISRKITNAEDRKRLKSAAQSLELPEGMGLIIRTAGESRTKVEIRRDYEYLLRMWDTIRETTLNSNAPQRVYEEGDLIKRAIRDLYNKDVTDIIVEGDEGYRNAKEFMRMLMPSHAKNVKPYQEPVPLYQRYHIEAQLDAMFQSTVTLRSGGYIVINQTEALVAIDVNSGRATREHSIEETARKTNLEAAEEIGRQLRLRDLAGLIVIDFIDMEDGRNDRDVEKRLRDAVRNDRARLQIGKISQFGLLEMSRQRLRAGVIAGSTVPCPHCGGQGIVRSVESTALRVLRGLEEEAQKQRAEALQVRVASDVAIYTLNQKRRELARLENEYSISIGFEPKNELMAGAFDIERIGARNPQDYPRPVTATPVEHPVDENDIDDLVEDELSEEDEAIETVEDADAASEAPESNDTVASSANIEQGEDGVRRRRRRRRNGRNRSRDRQPALGQPPQATNEVTSQLDGRDGPSEQDFVEGGEVLAPEPAPNEASAVLGDAQRRRRRRRRGRRGGNREGFRQPADQPGHISEGTPAHTPLSQTPASFGERGFDPVDEIDTTPRDEPAPNLPSHPSWSLNDTAEIDTTPKQDETPADPPKKGWWQRAFRS